MKNIQLDPIPAAQTSETLQEALKLYQLAYMPSRNFAAKLDFIHCDRSSCVTEGLSEAI